MQFTLSSHRLVVMHQAYLWIYPHTLENCRMDCFHQCWRIALDRHVSVKPPYVKQPAVELSTAPSEANHQLLYQYAEVGVPTTAPT